MEITRQRVRPAMSVDVLETCPTCFGTGKARPSILFTNQLEEKLDYLVHEVKMRKITVQVYPYIAAYIEKGLWSIKCQWKWNIAHLYELSYAGFLDFYNIFS